MEYLPSEWKKEQMRKAEERSWNVLVALLWVIGIIMVSYQIFDYVITK